MKNQIIADVCLYGTQKIGAGWIAQTNDGRLIGDGEPQTDLSFTEAIFLAADALQEDGHQRGLLRVFAPGGERMAVTNLEMPGYYGSLRWGPAEQYVIDPDALIAAN